MKQYLIDANILINFSIFTPMKYHKNFWEELTNQIQQKRLILLDTIAKECRGTELKEWLKGVKESIIIVDNDIKQRGIKINKEHNIITTELTGQIKSEPDTHLIAYAQKHNIAIFTYEGRRKSVKDPKKIPDVCRDLNITYQRFSIQVMNELNFAKCSE